MKKNLQMLLIGVFTFVVFLCMANAKPVLADGIKSGTLENPIRLEDFENGEEYLVHLKKGDEVFYVFETPSSEKIKDTKGYACLRVKPTDEYFKDNPWLNLDDFHWYDVTMTQLIGADAFIGTKEEMAERESRVWSLHSTGWRSNAFAYAPSTTYYLWFRGDEYLKEIDLRFWLDFPGEDSDSLGGREPVPATPVQLSTVVNASIHDFYDSEGGEARKDVLLGDDIYHDADNFKFTTNAAGNYTFEVCNTSALMDLRVLVMDLPDSSYGTILESFIVKKNSTVKNALKLQKNHTYHIEVYVEKSYLELHEFEEYEEEGMVFEEYIWDERDCLNNQKYWFSVTRHNYELKNTVAPTAIKLGYSDYVCKDCGEEYRSYKAPTGPLFLKKKSSTTDAVKVSWNFVKTAAGYQVQRSNNGGKQWESTHEIDDPATTIHTFNYLESARPYKFRVRYWVEAPNGRLYYAPWSKTLSAPTIPRSTTLSKLTAGKKAFKAQWKKCVRNTGFQLEYALKADFSKTKRVAVKDANTLTATVKKLTSGKVYYVRVRTYRTINNTNYFSAWSNVKKVKVK